MGLGYTYTQILNKPQFYYIDCPSVLGTNEPNWWTTVWSLGAPTSKQFLSWCFWLAKLNFRYFAGEQPIQTFRMFKPPTSCWVVCGIKWRFATFTLINSSEFSERFDFLYRWCNSVHSLLCGSDGQRPGGAISHRIHRRMKHLMGDAVKQSE